jgi:transposase, IS5 family
MHIIQAPLFDFDAFIAKKGNDRLAMVLEALPAEGLIARLEKEHWTGRKGYSIRGMWSALIAGLLGQAHSLTDALRLLERDKDIRIVCGISKDKIPSHDAMCRFLNKLVGHADLLEKCFTDLVKESRQLLPEFGTKLAVDSTDIKAYSNGHRQNPSDKEARWGAKGAGHHSGPTKKDKRRDLYYWFGYKLHMVVDVLYELPVSFELTPANESDITHMEDLLRKAGADHEETKPQAVMADKGYDSESNSKFIFNECHAAPIIPIREREGEQLPDICNAKGTPLCSCGLAMTYWGKDGNYLKYRCPQAVGKGKCKSMFRCSSSKYGYVLKLSIAADPRRHPSVPRESKKWQRLYRMRTAIERVNSRVKQILGLGHITVRGIGKVTVRAILSLLVMLAAGVSMAQRHRFNEVRSLVT